MRFVPKASPPNVSIGGPVPVSPGFPIEAFGNDELITGLGTAMRSKLWGIRAAAIETVD